MATVSYVICDRCGERHQGVFHRLQLLSGSELTKMLDLCDACVDGLVVWISMVRAERSKD